MLARGISRLSSASTSRLAASGPTVRITVRGVNVFPSAVENIIRRFKEVDEFRVTVYKEREMDEMTVEVELIEGADTTIAVAIGQAIDTALSFRPNMHLVPRGQLPRFELKSRRFHTKS